MREFRLSRDVREDASTGDRTVFRVSEVVRRPETEGINGRKGEHKIIAIYYTFK